MLRNELYQPWFIGEKDWGFEIIDGEFKDVSVQIQSIEFADKDNKVDLEYHIINKPEHITESDTKGELFVNVVELIINDILKEAIENHESYRNSNL